VAFVLSQWSANWISYQRAFRSANYATNKATVQNAV
jgi:hypothetical protein